MRDNRDILDKLRWLSNDMEYMDVPGEWLLPVTEAHSIIVRQREEIDRLRAALENIKDMTDYGTETATWHMTSAIHNVNVIARAALEGSDD